MSKRDGERPNAICVLPTDGGESRELLRYRATPTSLAWSPDGSRIAFTVPVDPDNVEETPQPEGAPSPVRATTRIDYKQDNRGYLDGVRHQVVLADVAGSSATQVTSELRDHLEPQWSPDGRTIAVKVTNRNGMHSQLGLVDVASATTELVGPEDGTLGTWRWSRDGTFILLDGDDRPTAGTDYFRREVASGQRVRLTTDLAFSPDSGFPTISPPSHPVWLDDSTALVLGTQAGESGLWTVDVQSGEITEVQRWQATHSGLSTDLEARVIAQVRSGVDGTSELVITDRETGRTRHLSGLNDAVFAESPLAEVELRRVERGGETIESWVYRPAGFDESRTYPVILDVHGGPHGNHGWTFNGGAQVLASNGYIVVATNPRGSGTYGRDFAQQVHGDWGGEDWLDLQAALDDVLQMPYADAARTGIYGYSYGGFMTAWAIGQTERFRAAVCGAPVFDMHSFYGTSDIGHDFGETQWGGTPLEIGDWMREQSPSTHVHKVTTPTLIVHGEADERCPIGQGEQMFVGLLKAGVETEFVRYPGGSHLMLRGGPSEHKIDYYTRVLGWFDRYLKA